MGYGSYSTASYSAYRCTTSVSNIEGMKAASLSDIYTERRLNQALSPWNVTRESCDSEEHPNSFPVILALDVTGSMGSAAQRVAAKLNDIMKSLYNKVPDVQFMFMGIGDMECDDAPVQITQFESDVRMAQQLEKIYFEGGGGGNDYETYTTAWYMGSRHCKLDCWKNGRRGLIITLGDEPLNPILRKNDIKRFIGDNVQDIDTKVLYEDTKEKYDIYHLSINDEATCYSYRAPRVDKSWLEVLPESHYKVCGLDDLADTITDIIKQHYDSEFSEPSCSNYTYSKDEDMISW